MAYDMNGDAYDPKQKPLGVLLAVFIALAIALVVFVMTTSGKPQRAEFRHDSLEATLTNDGSFIRWYVFIDPDTGAEYLVNDRGGCTPRLDKDGSYILVSGS